MTNPYTMNRQKKLPIPHTTILTPEQARRKNALLNGFIAQHWGEKRPSLYESLDQELIEEYEAFIDPYIQADIPVPEFNPRILAITNTKVCKSCLEEKPLDSFYVHTKTKDGRRPNCKQCMSAQETARRKAKSLQIPGTPPNTPSPMFATL